MSGGADTIKEEKP